MHTVGNLPFLLLQQRFGGRSGRIHELGHDAALAALIHRRTVPFRHALLGDHAGRTHNPLSHASASETRFVLLSYCANGFVPPQVPVTDEESLAILLSNRCHSLPDNLERS